MLFNYKYGGNSSVKSSAKSTNMSFAPDTLRQPTFFVGQLGKHLPFREAISALHDVVVSDLRFKPKDKTAYKEWAKSQEDIWLAEYIGEKMGDKQELDNKIADTREKLKVVQNRRQEVMAPYYKAQREYFNYLYQKDKDTWFVLDPVITVHPDEIFFECFSQDESTYGKLGCNYNVFSQINEFECGTTNIDYSAALYNEFQKIRTYKETEFKVDPSGFEVATEDEDVYKEVKIDLPDSWVRGFLQVSSAMTLEGVTFDLHPMDIHNICLHLRRYKEKHGPRSMKYILQPGEPIRIILEPWNHEIKCPRSFYTGPKAEEIRTWGRRRILILERLLPVAERFTVTLLGTGLPSFYVADLGGDMNFTLGLSGWTANDWSRAGNFDLMAPRMEVDNLTKQTVYNALKENWVEDVDSLAYRLGLGTDVVAGALSAYTQAGRAIYDMKLKKYRVRELSREPLPMEALRFASPIEEKANELIKRTDHNKAENVKAEKKSGILQLKGKIRDGNKTYHPSLSIDADQRIIQGSCSCNHYNMNELRKGPCEHILALRMLHNKNKF